MAQRGTPLPVPLRLQIRAQRTAATVRAVAKALNVSTKTVQKYGGKFTTNR